MCWRIGFCSICGCVWVDGQPQGSQFIRKRKGNSTMQIDRRQALLSIGAGAAVPTLTWAAKPKTPKKPQYVMYVKDMHCETCAKKVAAKLYAVPGVVKVATNLKNNFVIIEPQAKKKLSPKKIWQATIAGKQVPVKLVSPMGSFTKMPKK